MLHNLGVTKCVRLMSPMFSKQLIQYHSMDCAISDILICGPMFNTPTSKRQLSILNTHQFHSGSQVCIPT